MDVWLVTGGAGFIGSNFVRRVLARTAARVIVLDKLTYAGNLESLADVASSPRFHFVRADISDRTAVEQTLREHRPTAIVNFVLTLFMAYVLLECFWERNLKGPMRKVLGTLLSLAEELCRSLGPEVRAPWYKQMARAP